jgi:hypothetical protein
MVKKRIPQRVEYIESSTEHTATVSPSDGNARLESLATVIAFAEGDVGTAKVLQVAQAFHCFITKEGTH